MSNTNEPEVKDVERIEVTPAGDDDVVETPESSQEEPETDEPVTETPESEEPTEPTKGPEEPKTDNESAASETDENGEIKHLPGETPREYASRLEITRLKGELRKERSSEILTPPPAPTKKELSPEKKKVLEKYKQEDLNTLREVFDVMAEDMGFVRQDQLGATAYQQKATEVLDDFLEKHPEYQPQNDKDNVLWDRFKGEYSLYRPTQNPKDLKRILDKVHKEVFGIKPAAALKNEDAAKEKIKVASHNSASRPSANREGVKRANAPQQGLRTDMLKGFSDEEISELVGEE